MSPRAAIATLPHVLDCSTVSFPQVTDARYVVLDEDYTIVFAASVASPTVTLPAASPSVGRVYQFVRPQAVVVGGIGFAGPVPVNLPPTPYHDLTVQSDGANWYVTSYSA